MKRVLAWFVLLVGLGCAVAGTLLLTVLAPPRQLDVTETSTDPGTAVVTAPACWSSPARRPRCAAAAPRSSRCSSASRAPRT